ncbi:hypothetical protein DOU02_15740 [Clavibacter michiganensis subsp. michiganensis]|nr:hypothetical protein DOU02_15740 [Clavibacter michiganensis subsp. michiganensis]
MTLAPLSTAQRTASAICESSSRAPGVGPPSATETLRTLAAGATPITPDPVPVPRPARSDATIVPCSLEAPTGFVPSADPTPETSVPPATAPRRSATDASTPVSMTATFTPSPRVVCHACSMP